MKNGIVLNKKQLVKVLPVCVVAFVLLLVVCGKVVLTSLTSSVYGISELNDNLDSIKTGDIINYNINGYSEWKVLTVDKANGTIEVTSKTSVKDLTVEPYKSVDEYNALFQSEAEKFNDNNYVINARTISKADSLTFDSDSDDEYWLSNVNESTLMTNKTGDSNSDAIWTKPNFDIDTIYLIPYIGISNPYNYIPDVGSEINFSSNGIDTWIFSGQFSPFASGNNGEKVLLYTPKYPIPLSVSSIEDIGNIVQNYFESFDNSNILDYGNYLSKFPGNFHDTILRYEAKNIFDNTDQIMYFVSGVGGGVETINNKYNIEKKYLDYGGEMYDNHCDSDYYHGVYKCDMQIYRFNTSDLSSATAHDFSSFYEPKTLTFGYKPVLTLKVSEGKKGSDVSNSLKVGDYVNYEANGYKNWRVLSINNAEGTVDVISGGIVKNLSLFGKADYDDYENILQREVEAYMVGNRALSARAIQESDVDLLKSMGDEVDAFYWFNKKTKRRMTDNNLENDPNLTHGVIDKEMTLNAGVLKNTPGDYGKSYPVGYWVRLYSDYNNSPGFDGDQYVEHLGNGDLSYTAGLRPIIKLKISSVDVLPPNESKNISSDTHKSDSNLYKAQQSKNRYSKISVISGSDYGGGIGSDYYDYDSIYNNSSGYCNSRDTINIGESNGWLRWLFIILFVYGVIFAFGVMMVFIRLIKKRMI